MSSDQLVSPVDTAVESVTVDDKIVTSGEEMNTSEEESDNGDQVTRLTPDTLATVTTAAAHSSWLGTQDTLHSTTNSKG